MTDSDLRRLVTVATFESSVEASLARGALEAIGITAFIPGESLGVFSRNRGGPAAIELQVRASDGPQAMAELKRLAQTG